ncbi:hypothetical protein ACLESD_22100 [Pyxidicoccus sp. 3LFB2]
MSRTARALEKLLLYLGDSPKEESLLEVARRKKPELALAIEQHRASK